MESDHERNAGTERAAALTRLLHSSVEGIVLALSSIPTAWLRLAPGGRLPGFPAGSWTALENLTHLVHYEETLAAPVAEEIAAGREGVAAVEKLLAAGNEEYRRRLEQLEELPAAVMVWRLRAVRERQVTALRRAGPRRLGEPVTPVWGLLGGAPTEPPASLDWVLSKTMQHTWEHGNAMLRIALGAARQDARRRAPG